MLIFVQITIDNVCLFQHIFRSIGFP